MSNLLVLVMLHFTVYPKKYAHGFCFAVLCCGNTLTDFPISIRLTSLALWQSNDCPSASKATLMNMDKYFMWIHYERLHNHNKAKHNKTVCIFLGIYCRLCMCDASCSVWLFCLLSIISYFMCIGCFCGNGNAVMSDWLNSILDEWGLGSEKLLLLPLTYFFLFSFSFQDSCQTKILFALVWNTCKYSYRSIHVSWKILFRSH